MKYIQKLIDTFDNTQYPIFKINDVKLILRSSNVSTDYIYLLLHNLIKKQKIRRVTRGAYTFHQDSAVIGFVFQPFYYGLESALWINGVSEQGANYTIMTSGNVRGGIREFEGRNYNIKRINNNLLFGYNLVKLGEFWIPVSDLEKTVLDILYFYGSIRDENFTDITKRLNEKKIRRYIKHYDKRSVKRMIIKINDMKRYSDLNT